MLKTNTKISDKALVEAKPSAPTNSAFELVGWPHPYSSISSKVLALQTTRLSPQLFSVTSTLPTETLQKEISAFDSFNLGLHVGDNAQHVTENRNELSQFINKQLTTSQAIEPNSSIEQTNIQWLNQVHGSDVVEVATVSSEAITADASITRQKNIALAIMTADCLPILLSHKEGREVAAIHGGWRPLAANIIEKTLNKMQSKPSELVAWLGPCIGDDAFEVGCEVKAAFLQLSAVFEDAFLKQKNGKYLANLHKIALCQLQILGVTDISALAECTYQQNDKYYSYRKEQVTGRMASVICRR